MSSPFNSPLETGVRALTLLEALYPEKVDLQRLVDFDYLVVHSGDAGGPQSLHAPLPLRKGELLVRRDLIEKGLMLMMSRGLAVRRPGSSGFWFWATEQTRPFLDGLSSPYIAGLRERASWVAEQFGGVSDEELKNTIREQFDEWTTQFQPVEIPVENTL